MFKARFIESTKYYQSRRKMVILALLPLFLLILIVNLFQVSPRLVIPSVALQLVAAALIAIWARKVYSTLANRVIEMDAQEIRIIAKTASKNEIIQLDHVDKIKVKDDYSMPLDTVSEIGKEFTGKGKQNYIIVHHNNEERQLYFEVETFYMIAQLKKLIESWKNRGYPIETMSQAQELSH